MIQYKIRLLSIFVIVFQRFYDVLKFRKTILATLQDLKFKVKKFEQTSKTVYFLIYVFVSFVFFLYVCVTVSYVVLFS